MPLAIARQPDIILREAYRRPNKKHNRTLAVTGFRKNQRLFEAAGLPVVAWRKLIRQPANNKNL